MTQAQIDKAHHDALRCPTCGEVNGQCLVVLDGELRDCPDPRHPWNKESIRRETEAARSRELCRWIGAGGWK